MCIALKVFNLGFPFFCKDLVNAIMAEGNQSEVILLIYPDNFGFDSYNHFLSCSCCDLQANESAGMATATAMPVKERPPSR